MRFNRMLLSATLIVVALVIQVSVLARLQLPGAVPDLLLLVVLGLALVYGHVGGALIGFAAGLLADLAPPADHAAGRYALVLCVIGYLAGLVKPENGRLKSATGPMARRGRRRGRLHPAVRRCRRPRRRHRRPPCRSRRTAVHRRPVRPAARAVRRPAGHGPGQARRERPARREPTRRQPPTSPPAGSPPAPDCASAASAAD